MNKGLQDFEKAFEEPGGAAVVGNARALDPGRDRSGKIEENTAATVDETTKSRQELEKITEALTRQDDVLVTI